MSHRIPSDLPKVWPYDPAYRGHVSKALSLREDPCGAGHLLLAGGILLIIIGLPLFIIPLKIFGYSFLFGIIICIVSIPFVIYANKKQKKEFSRVMDEVRRQVSAETKELELKATAGVGCENADDQDNMRVMETSIAV